MTTFSAPPLPYAYALNAAAATEVIDNLRIIELDNVISCTIGEGEKVLHYTYVLTGSLFDTHISADTLAYDYALSGFGVASEVVNAEVFAYSYKLLTVAADVHKLVPRNNWVKWSDIGNLDFTLNQRNLAGERPMSWPGQVYQVKKLGKGVAIFGSTGISVMVPKAQAWGYIDVSYQGIRGAGAVAGNSHTCWYLGQDHKLYEMTESISCIGYAEEFASLGEVYMFYEPIQGLLYICDGTTGFVYSPKEGSLAEGVGTITGVGTVGGVPTIVASATYIAPTPELVSTVMDFGTRKEKTLFGVDLGVNVDQWLQAAFYFRTNYRNAWQITPWVPVTQYGSAVLMCHGIEFKLAVKAQTAVDFSLDYATVTGVVHDYNTLDS